MFDFALIDLKAGQNSVKMFLLYESCREILHDSTKRYLIHAYKMSVLIKKHISINHIMPTYNICSKFP